MPSNEGDAQHVNLMYSALGSQRRWDTGSQDNSKKARRVTAYRLLGNNQGIPSLLVRAEELIISNKFEAGRQRTLG